MGGSAGVKSGAPWARSARRWLIAGSALLPLAGAYALTVGPDLGVIDSGELGVVCAHLGIAHPTGYPLYTLLGRISVQVLPGSPITILNGLSALAAWLAVAGTVVLAAELLGRRGPMRWLEWTLALVAGYWVGTNRILWEQATGNEVYSLHLTLASLLLLLLVRLTGLKAGPRGWLALSYFAGLGLTHHLSIVFLFPAGALVLFWGRRWLGLRAGGLPLLAWMILLGALAWSANLYLPIRSVQDPMLDWGDPTSWHRFWRHHLAVQYRVWQFQSIESWGGHVLGYLRELPGRVSWPALVLALAAPFFRRENGRSLIVLALVWISTVVWASGYDIHDLAPYFLSADLAWVGMAVIGAAGLGEVGRRALIRRSCGAATLRNVSVAAAALLVVSALDPLWRHAGAVDRSRDHFVREYATAVLQSLPEDAVVLSSFWDAVVSPALYLQQIEGMRPDVTIVDIELLRRSWYFPQLRRTYPGFLDPVEARIATFSEQLELFEAGRPYDPAVIERAYRAVIDGIARAGWPERPVALTPDQPPGLIPGLVAVPEGPIWILYEDPSLSPPLLPLDLDRLLASGYRPGDRIHRLVLEQWRVMAAQRAGYLEQFGRPEEAIAWRELSQRVGQRLLDDGVVP